MLSRWRVIRTLFLFLVSMLAILYIASRLFILSSFEDLERQLVRTQIDRVQDALSARLDALGSKTGDWATWDDVYEFVDGKNPAFASTEVTDATFTQLEINLMMFVKASGEVMHFRAFDLEGEQPVRFQYIDKIQLDKFLKTLTPESRLAGLILLPDHPVLIAARPIVKNDGTGTPRGAVVFGRYLDENELEDLAATTHLTFTMHRVDQPLPGNDLRSLLVNLSDQTPQIVQPINDQTIVGYAVLKDIYTAPALLLKVEQPRDVYQQGWNSVIYFILALTAVACTLGTVVYIMGERLVRSQQKQRQSEQLYYSLAEAAPDAIYVVDNKKRIKYANEAAKQAFENRWEEIVGASNGPISTDEPGHEIAEVLESKHPLHFERALKTAGQNSWLDVKLVPMRTETGNLDTALCIARDVTERKQTEARIQRQLRRLDALHTIDQAITSGLDLAFTLNVVLAQAESQLNIDAADILLYNQRTAILELTASSGFNSALGNANRVTLDDGLAGHTVSGHKSVAILNLHKPRLGLQRYETFSSEKFVSGFAAPLISRGKVRGVLEVFSRTYLNPDEEWLSFLETLAGQAAIAVDSIETFKNLQRSNTELAEAYDTTIEGWTQALDLRDKETEGHSQRVTELTLLLAHSLGVDDGELAHIRRGALLHDIGKMAIPDSILLKPGPLTTAEWQIIRKHPVHAQNMLSSIPYLSRAIDIPYSHHEKWDGTGYPDQLSGEAIPYSARIFAVVDVWDALRSDRPYRAAWSSHKTKEYLLSQAGKHFDPQIVKAFLQLLEHQGK